MVIQHKIKLVRATHWALKNWLVVFLIFWGVFNILPFLAPLFAKLGWQGLANAIYIIYAPFCHQMAQRSFFLFGPQIMYTPQQLPIDITGSAAIDTLSLRFFTGNEALGWKVAWSDRMVFMYGATWFAGLFYTIRLRRGIIKPLSLIGFILFLLPMALDGGTHTISDFSAQNLFEGFRYTNDWLAALTQHSLPDTFYVGDGLGSFNSWMRLLTGVSFGIGVVWFLFPRLDREMRYQAYLLENKLRPYTE